MTGAFDLMHGYIAMPKKGQWTIRDGLKPGPIQKTYGVKDWGSPKAPALSKGPDASERDVTNQSAALPKACLDFKASKSTEGITATQIISTVSYLVLIRTIERWSVPHVTEIGSCWSNQARRRPSDRRIEVLLRTLHQKLDASPLENCMTAML